jgi:hypothetical protein
VLLGGEVPSFRRDGEAWPVDVAEEGDWEGDLGEERSIHRWALARYSVTLVT